MHIPSLLLTLALTSLSSASSHHLHHRHAHPAYHNLSPSASHLLHKRADVFNVPGGIWPTVTVPAGFTLAAGVELTPLATASPTDSAGKPLSPSAALAAAALQTGLPNAFSSRAWDADASSACNASAGALGGKSSNPSGLCVCFNVAYLDARDGAFMCEVRVYQVAEPTGEWASVDVGGMSVGISFPGANLSYTGGGSPSSECQKPATGDGGGAMAPCLLATQHTSFRPYLDPVITINGNSPTGPLSTAVNTTEASFVTGVFSRASSTNDTSPKALLGKPAAQLAAQAAGLPTPFVVPGVSLGVFPTGLIITGAWVLIFATAVGGGTVQRVRWREQYRRQVRARGVEGVRRF
ncbi:hypothetical protein EJ06DRAFT_555588 [Trichodelitschia bisporula]|uniref:Uncharacterized protein n=1 Tax=Trichodelitschia bisporula TaxID=703511 RepID=A0A6G1I0Z6_9PEZI|nr:hypothetical protein EJ06DRAFT_555588 [Trichodelitschia bisporula]